MLFPHDLYAALATRWQDVQGRIHYRCRCRTEFAGTDDRNTRRNIILHIEGVM